MGHILVVDDDLLTCTTLTLILEDAGYIVHTAVDGAEALERIVANPPLLVVSDIRLPRLSGLQLLEALRANPATVTLPVLLTSASVRPQLSAGCNCTFLEKPISIDTLLAVVAHLLATATQARTVGVVLP